MIISNLKNVFQLTTVIIFVFSGIYLLVIDRIDLSKKSLKGEQKAATIIGVLYIFGSVALFILLKYLY